MSGLDWLILLFCAGAAVYAIESKLSTIVRELRNIQQLLKEIRDKR